jgi:hypothetical protein
MSTKRDNAVTAMGKRNGDVLELHNQWAKVVIARELQEQPAGKDKVVFIVDGDLADIRAREKTFPTMQQALAYAWHSLAEYERGAYR